MRSVFKYIADADSQYPLVEQIIKIKADVGKPVQNLFEQFTKDTDETLYLLMCPVVVILTCEDPNSIHSVQVTYECCSPFTCSDTVVCLDTVNGTEIVETQVFVSTESDISNSRVNISFTITDSKGKINVLTREVVLPLSLYCSPAEEVADNKFQLVLETNQSAVDVTEIFTGKSQHILSCLFSLTKLGTDIISDFTKEELLIHGRSHDITFVYRATRKTVTIKAIDKQYSIEADDITEITSVLLNLITRLSEYYARINVNDFLFNVRLNVELTKQITHSFLKSIEVHAKERNKLNELEVSN